MGLGGVVTAVWLAWRDLAARPGRNLLAVGVIAACTAVATWAELEESSRDSAVAAEVDEIAAPLRIVPASSPGTGPALMHAGSERLVREAAGDAVRAIEPWLAFETWLGGAKARLVGVPRTSSRAVAVNGRIALGSALAQRLGASDGERLVLAGRPLVASVLQAHGDADDAAAFVSLEEAQGILGNPEAISELRVRFWPTARIQDVKARIRDKVPGVVALRVERGEIADEKLGSTVRAHHLAILLATALAALLCLALASWLDAAERRLELAGLVALGATPFDVVLAVAARSWMLAVVGAGGGLLTAVIAAASTGDVGAVLASTPMTAGVAVGAAAVLGTLAAAPVAAVAAWRTPVPALQEAAN